VEVTNGHLAPRLGDLLVGKGLITDEQLADALSVHERTGTKLGEVLTKELHLLSAPVLGDLLLLQRNWRPLGQLLVEAGLLDAERLLEALDEQRRTGKPLGEIVEERFYVSSARIRELLQQQHEAEIEVEQGYASGLRSALLQRPPGSGEERADESREPGGGRPRLAERLALSESSSDAHVDHARKAVESRERKIASLNAVIAKQYEEISHLRDALADCHFTVIELETELRLIRSASALQGTTDEPSPSRPA
jgi:hypothetical protein